MITKLYRLLISRHATKCDYIKNEVRRKNEIFIYQEKNVVTVCNNTNYGLSLCL